MREEAQKFIDEEKDNIGYGEKLDGAISRFEELSIEAQYEILMGTLKKSIEKVNAKWIFHNEGGPNKNKGCGIINILNSKFPIGTSFKEIIYNNEELYINLPSYQPHQKGGLSSILGELNIFKDENGNLNKETIIKYLSDPRVEIYGEYMSDIFKYLDKDSDRKAIIKIIEGRLENRALRMEWKELWN